MSAVRYAHTQRGTAIVVVLLVALGAILGGAVDAERDAHPRETGS